MPIDWTAIQKAMYPIRSFADLSQKWHESLKYPFVHRCFNYSMIDMVRYTEHILGEDSRNRYERYCEALVRGFTCLDQAEVRDIVDLLGKVNDQEKFESFSANDRIAVYELVEVLKFLVYWFLPTKKGLRQLLRPDQVVYDVIGTLRTQLVRSNLDLLERGSSAAERIRLADECCADRAVVIELVNRADFSRMPWASAATISNIIGAGYHSIEELANADLEQVRERFYRYGESIGKNLLFGNEIDNSYRIAKLVPRILTS